MDSQKDKQIDRQTDRQTDRHPDTLSWTDSYQYFLFSNRVVDVARGVVELIEDDSKIGEVLVICVTDGTKYKKFVDKVGLMVNSYLSHILYILYTAF